MKTPRLGQFAITKKMMMCMGILFLFDFLISISAWFLDSALNRAQVSVKSSLQTEGTHLQMMQFCNAWSKKRKQVEFSFSFTSVVDDRLGESSRAKFVKWSHSHMTFAPVVLTRLQPSVDQPPR